MAENLKLKLNKNIKNLIFGIIFFYTTVSPIFAEELGEIPADDFLDSLQVDVPSQAANIAEQNMAAEQVGDSAIQGGNNLLLTLKDQLQNFGDVLGANLEKITGGNPLITKILVGLVLVFISVFIITILVLIAKKFVFKNKTVRQKNLFANKNDLIVDNNDNLQYTDNSEYDEYEEEYQDDYDDEYSDSQPVQQSENANIVNSSQNIENTSLSLSFDSDEPKTIADAMKIFMIVTD